MTNLPLIKIDFPHQKFNSQIPSPKFHFGQPIIVEKLEDIDEDQYIITGIILSYSPEVSPFWIYCVGTEETTYLELNFTDSWHPENELRARTTSTYST